MLTDNGIQFADLSKNRQGPTAHFRGHPFDRLCLLLEIEHRLTTPNHPWTNGQVERMNRSIKDATVKRYFYDTHNQLKAHLTDFLRTYNFARRLKTLRALVLMNTSANSGPKPRTDLLSTQSIKCRDYIARDHSAAVLPGSSLR